MTALTLNLNSVIKLTTEQFYQLCEENRDLKLELHLVWNRPRLRERIDPSQAIRLEQQLQYRAIWIELKTVPPNCRDPKDLPVLATEP